MEQKGPIDLLRRIKAGAKAAKTAYSTTVEAEKLNQIKAAKRAAAAEKAKATREANKAARLKAAEEAAAAPKRGRKPNSTASSTKSTSSKKSNKKPVINTGTNEGFSKSDKKGLGWLYGTMGALGAGTVALSSKSKKSEAPTGKDVIEKQKAKERSNILNHKKSKYQFAKGGIKKKR